MLTTLRRAGSSVATAATIATIDHSGALVRSHRLTLGALAVGLLDQQADNDRRHGDESEHEARRQGHGGALGTR